MLLFDIYDNHAGIAIWVVFGYKNVIWLIIIRLIYSLQHSFQHNLLTMPAVELSCEYTPCLQLVF